MLSILSLNLNLVVFSASPIYVVDSKSPMWLTANLMLPSALNADMSKHLILHVVRGSPGSLLWVRQYLLYTLAILYRLS